MSSRVLAQRSAIPAVFSRASRRPRSSVTREEKGRLLRVGKRSVKGPFNALVDPTEFGAGSAMLEPTEAVKKSGTYDIWAHTGEAELMSFKGKGNFKDPDEFLLPLVVRPRVKVSILLLHRVCTIHNYLQAPQTPHPHRSIDLPAIVQPHQGSSYNPIETAHRELLLTAHEVEQHHEAAAAKFAGVKERMAAAQRTVIDEAEARGAPDMLIDSNESSPEAHDGAEKDAVPLSKVPARKTQQQRRKAAKLLAEVPHI